MIKKPLTQLSKSLAYEFKDPSLFELALTHRSCGKRNNERLEFLGDSILNHVIAADLFYRFPNAREGELSRLRARLVKGETLAEIARELELGDYLRLGSGELKSGGFRRESILADAVEAIIGAIYLDTGMETASEFVLSHYQKRLEDPNLQQSLKDSKTRLQEYLQGRQFELPIYELVDTKGEAHAQTFYVQCHTPALSQYTKASGNSRRQAEQEAARLALLALKVEK